MSLLACYFQHTVRGMSCPHMNPALVPIAFWRRSSHFSHLKTPLPAPSLPSPSSHIKLLLWSLPWASHQTRGFNFQILSHTQPSPPLPCSLKPSDAFLLTENEIRLFIQANEDTLALIASVLYVSCLSFLSSCQHMEADSLALFIYHTTSVHIHLH